MADSDAIRRKEAIEEKRKRVADMKKSREDRLAAAPPAAAAAPAPVPTPVPVAPAPKNEEETKAETEDLVNSLLAAPAPVSKPQPAHVAEQPQKSRQELLQAKLQLFSTVKSFNTYSILPTVAVKYDKSCQTEEEDQLFLEKPSDSNTDGAVDYEVDEDDENIDQADAASIQGRTPAKGLKSPSPRKELFSSSKHSQKASKFSAELEAEAAFTAHAQTKLSEDERSAITSNRKFQDFLQTTSLYIERALALAEEHDVLRDFSVDEKGNTGDLAEHAAFQVTPAGHATAASSTASVYEEESLAGRPVMDLKWSPLVPELFLAAYGAKAAPVVHNAKNAAASSSRATTEEEAPGVVCVWSKDLHNRPEYRFTASSPVLAAVFHTQEQNLVIGGCYSGQILLWDMKLNKSLPVQRSSMAGKGHKHPVYAMAMTTSAVAAELVSVSTDGLLCHWDVTRLAEPTSVVQLHTPATSAPSASLSLGGFLSPVRDTAASLFGSTGALAQQNPLNISAMAFGHSAGSSSGDGPGSTDIIFGSGSGQLVRTPLPYKDNHPHAAKVEAHYGLITSIEPHPSRSNKYKHLLLSSSLDWTVKLWDLKNFAQPIIEFFSPTYDYVSDVQWSPVHPAVFVTITSSGRISLWNLAKSSTEPVDAVDVVNHTEDSAGNTTGTAASSAAAHAPLRALNKVVWARDGQSVLCGDSQGTLHLLKLHPAAVLPTPVDEGRFEMAIVSHQMDHHAHLASGESKFTSKEGTPKKRSDHHADAAMEDAVRSHEAELNFNLSLE